MYIYILVIYTRCTLRKHLYRNKCLCRAPLPLCNHDVTDIRALSCIAHTSAYVSIRQHTSAYVSNICT